MTLGPAPDAKFSVTERQHLEKYVDVRLARVLRIFALPILALNIAFATTGPFLYPQTFSFLGKLLATSSHWFLCGWMFFLILRIEKTRRAGRGDANHVRLLFVLMLLNSIVYGNSAFHIFDPEQTDQVLPFILNIVITCIVSGFGLAAIRWLPVAAVGPALSFVVAKILLLEGATSDIFAYFLLFFGGLLIFLTDITYRLAVSYFTNEASQQILIERLNQKNAELDHARQQARQASASKSSFLATIGHDLRQPLQAARLLVEGMSAPGQEETKSKALTALSSLNQLSDDLITAGHVSDPERVSSPINISCNDIMIRAIESVAPTAQALNREVDVVPTGQWVRTDPVMTARILQNLLSNALKYTRGDRILLGARRRGARVRFEVWDQGAGISPAERGGIFEEFVRLDRADTRHVSGLGLGLSLAKSLADDLDAELGFRSWPGRGSVFFIDAPWATPIQKEKSRSLLIIEDNPLDALAVEAAARSLGWVCVSVTSIAEALQTLSLTEVDIDAVVSDYSLTDGETGFDVLGKVTKPNSLPLLIVTGTRLSEIEHELFENAVDVLPKPIRARHLKRLL